MLANFKLNVRPVVMIDVLIDRPRAFRRRDCLRRWDNLPRSMWEYKSLLFAIALDLRS